MTLKINLIGYISLSKYTVIPFQDQHSNAEKLIKFEISVSAPSF